MTIWQARDEPAKYFCRVFSPTMFLNFDYFEFLYGKDGIASCPMNPDFFSRRRLTFLLLLRLHC